MPTIAGRAFAKINLGLRILGRRADGYHELRTVFQTVSLADELTVEYSPRGRAGVTIACNIAELEGPENLACRAAERLLSRGGWKGRVALRLVKKIPAGAGLGGGSSNAGAVLLALRRLLRPAPSASLLLSVAAELGSDIPFFLVGGRAVGIGRGEEVYPLPDGPARPVLLLLPPFPSSTADAYRALAESRGRGLTGPAKQNMMEGFCAGVSVPQQSEAPNLSAAPVNDFESVIFRNFPELEQWKKRLKTTGSSSALLSGSGSALFGIYADRDAARQARAAFVDFPGKTYIVSMVGRRRFQAVWS